MIALARNAVIGAWQESMCKNDIFGIDPREHAKQPINMKRPQHLKEAIAPVIEASARQSSKQRRNTNRCLVLL